MPEHSVIALSVDNLACRRGEHDVFSGLSFSLAPGQALMLRGPNGAGKTSLLMCLAGYLPSIAGRITWAGLPRDAEPTGMLQMVGHLTGIKPALTLAENLAFWADLYGGDRARLELALEQAGLQGLNDLPAGILSAGQTRRLSLCRLLLAPRPVWLLDEPTANLDSGGNEWIRGLIGEHLSTGGLAVIATHRDMGLGKAHELVLKRSAA
jgi:heme exporter protein A